MNILLIPVGSAGDVHPFVGLGLALQRRGHRVTLITGEYFHSLAQRVGLEFVPVGTMDDFHRVVGDPDLWHPLRGFKTVMQGAVLPFLRPGYELVAERYVPGDTLVVASSLAFGARVAHDKLGVPIVTIHLQPSVLRSAIQTPILPGFFAPDWLPHAFKWAQFWLADKLLVDRVLAGPINQFRAEFGLPPVRRILNDWWHSPQKIIGLFPDWFAARQPDWPQQTVLTGFALYDERGATEPPADLNEFIAAGDPPLVFTPGSANAHGQSFFVAAAEACQRLGRRGLLLTRFPEQVPHNLPASVRHVDFVPLSWLLPRSAALIHHGGIGTMAQAFAAGVPQLIMPMTHDQPDNAARAVRLGVARSLPPNSFRGEQVARNLDLLLTAPQIAESCRSVAARFQNYDALAATCDVLETMS